MIASAIRSFLAGFRGKRRTRAVVPYSSIPVAAPPLQKKVSNARVMDIGHVEMAHVPGVFKSRFQLDLSKWNDSGERDGILASSGMGKSYLTGIMMEETLKTKGLLCVIDPQGEAFTLAWDFPVMVVGGDKTFAAEWVQNHPKLKPTQKEIGLKKSNDRKGLTLFLRNYEKQPGETKEEKDARLLAMQNAIDATKKRIDQFVDTMLSKGVSTIFDLSEHNKEEQQYLFHLIGESVYTHAMKYRRKFRFVAEECQIYAPEKNGGLSVNTAAAIAKQGRKLGIDSLWATQRPASVSKNVISQCCRFWFGGIKSVNDFKAIQSYLSDAGVTQQDIQALEAGQFYYFDGKAKQLIKTKQRQCVHGGETPQFDDSLPVASSEELDEILEGLN